MSGKKVKKKSAPPYTFTSYKWTPYSDNCSTCFMKLQQKQTSVSQYWYTLSELSTQTINSTSSTHPASTGRPAQPNTLTPQPIHYSQCYFRF